MITLPAGGLPLTAFEELMLVDDRASHPMMIVMRFDFVDDAPPRNLEDAFHDTLQYEPLLTARVESRVTRRPRWTPGPQPRLHRSRVSVVSEGLTEWTGPLPRLDARTGPVLHADIVEHGAGWSIVLAVHHAASDGIGLMGFLERWLLAAEGKPGRWRRQSEAALLALRNRGRVAPSWGRFARMAPGFAKGLGYVGDFLGHDVLALEGQGSGPPGCRQPRTMPATEPLIVSLTLDAAAVQGLAERAHRNHVRVNDLLAAALAVTLGEHVAPPAPGRGASRQPWMRIGVPMNLRGRTDHVLPAANRIGMVFLDRTPADCKDPLPLMLGMFDQMETIRTHALGHLFALGLEWTRLLPGGLRRSADRRASQCTAVLSNVGRSFHRTPLLDGDGAIRVGSGRMSGWWGVPPIRPGTALAAGTHETLGRRTITFQADRDRVPLELAERLIRRMASELHYLAAGYPATAAMSKMDAI